MASSDNRILVRPPISRMAYGDEKQHKGASYRGMPVGGVHRWTYPDGQWTERKVTPQRWEVAFTSRKQRRARAPEDSGAEVGSGYHWLIVAHQWAGKLDANTYATHLEGTKHLVSFRKPGWQGWTTQQRGHTSARLRTIMALEELIAELRDARDEDFEDPKDLLALEGLLADEAAEREEGRKNEGRKDEGRKAHEKARAPATKRRATSRPSRRNGLRRSARSRTGSGAATPTPRPRRR